MRRALLVLIAACSSKSERVGHKVAVPPPPVDAAPRAATPALPAPKPMAPPIALPNAGPEPMRFRHSSVRGDFRVYPVSGGLVTSWKNELSGRSRDGHQLWRDPDYGRAVAISPDGTRAIANNDDGDIVIFDAASGATLASGGLGVATGYDDVYVSAFAYTPDGQHILAIDSKHVYLLHADATFDRELPSCPGCFLVSAVALSDTEALLSDANGSLLRFRLSDGKVLARTSYQAHDLDLSPDRKRVITDGYGAVAMYDAHTLQLVWDAPIPGEQGVPAGGGTEQWKPVPKFSPDGTEVTVQDLAGRLWLLDARNGHPMYELPREVANYVEDFTWLGRSTLAIIDNPGRVIVTAGIPPVVLWSRDDAPMTSDWDPR